MWEGVIQERLLKNHYSKFHPNDEFPTQINKKSTKTNIGQPILVNIKSKSAQMPLSTFKTTQPEKPTESTARAQITTIDTELFKLIASTITSYQNNKK